MKKKTVFGHISPWDDAVDNHGMHFVRIGGEPDPFGIDVNIDGSITIRGLWGRLIEIYPDAANSVTIRLRPR